MKKLQNVHIVILIALFIGFLFSFFMLLSNFKEMLNAKRENVSVPTSISVLREDKQPYTVAQYQDLLNILNRNVKARNINIEIKNAQIVITSPLVDHELEVRQTLIELLALDKNLYVSSMCGKVNNSCNGYAIEVVIAGENKNAKIAKGGI